MELNPITRLWTFGGQRFELGRFPKLMGIVNVTPDSFSDGGHFTRVDAAVNHGLQLVEEGADILDIGGESTRPGATPVSLKEELARVLPVMEALKKQTTLPLSIDTTKAEVMMDADTPTTSTISATAGSGRWAS
jgi:dihydropteroate synthase